jgi:limonene-1,2-epoxide hydrolase
MATATATTKNLLFITASSRKWKCPKPSDRESTPVARLRRTIGHQLDEGRRVGQVLAMTPEDTVRAFITAVEAKLVDAAAAYLAEDVSYENVPMAPVQGRDAAIAVLAPFLANASEIEWRIVRQVAAESTVMNERIDRFKFGETWVELPVCGRWDVNQDGLITLWRDYFDLATFTRQMQALQGQG